MELHSLDGNFHADQVVDNYESLIWTERYATNGEFELVSSDVAGIQRILPISTPERDSYVALRDSLVPMVVEVHKIQEPPDGPRQITVTGRSFDTVLERRPAVKELNPASTRVQWKERAEKESDAAYKVIRQVIGDPLARIPPVGTATALPPVLPGVAPEDAIPEINLPIPEDYEGPTTPPTTYSKEFEIPSKDLYSTVLEMIGANHHGIKASRPLDSSHQVDIEIYNGADLTHDVIFDVRVDQFDDAVYLLSRQGSANVAYVFGKTQSAIIRKNELGAPPSGLMRRVIMLDPPSDDVADSADVLRSRGLVDLYKYNATALFSGELAEHVASLYNAPGGYSLGDIVYLQGKYGLGQSVRVAEFIRSVDPSGKKAYPTFEVVDNE